MADTEMEPELEQKRGRGRPRKNPLQPKRPIGRPRKGEDFTFLSFRLERTHRERLEALTDDVAGLLRGLVADFLTQLDAEEG